MSANNDKSVLAARDTAPATSESSEEIDITSESVQASVKDELEHIVLALVLKQPMCGTDIIKTIHGKFGLLLSPGTIYPLLHGLEKEGLLQHEHGAKEKTYKPVDGTEEKIRNMLDEQVNAKKIIIKFLKFAE